MGNYYPTLGRQKTRHYEIPTYGRNLQQRTNQGAWLLKIEIKNERMRNNNEFYIYGDEVVY